jgi:hypothetical protein
MLDVFNIPNNQDNVSIFYANGSAWQTWRKPRNCSYVWMMCIGGGGGGAGVIYTNNLSGTTVNTAGTCGGGSGAVTRALYNASLIPDLIYVQVGLGGAGGAAAGTTTLVNGASGTRSFISSAPITSVQNVFCCSGTVGAGGGQYAAGGAGETVATTGVAGIISMATWSSTVGQAGALAGASITPLTSQITSGGAGGGGLNSSVPISGGSINATSISSQILGSAGNPSVIAGCGTTSFKPFFSLGGAGGGGGFFTNIVGGGNGGIGSGGGGSGVLQNGGSSFTGTTGGNGGDGIVFIIAI